ncbi:FUSC family protein [Streptomyces cinereus]|nr:FUSC family protein [Streptomyces cinereus]
MINKRASHLDNPITHQYIKHPLTTLTQFNRNPRPWHMPLFVAFAISFPVMVGAYLGDLRMGLLASLGAMVILNLPYTGSLLSRMTTVLACSFGMVACFAVGLVAHNVPILTIPLMFFVTFWCTLFSRYYKLPPPAGLFIIMASAIALFMPAPVSQIPQLIGVVALGALFAGMVACFYALLLIYNKPVLPVNTPMPVREILGDTLIVSAFIALSLLLALWLEMPKPYWVPMSCYVIMQGMNFQSMWIKQIHRIVGTAIGMLLAWLLLSVHLSDMGVALGIFGMMFCIETFVVRHYGVAVIFITPLTIFLAEYSAVQPTAISEIIVTRFWDTVLGCLMGVLGGIVILSPMVRQKLQVIVDKIVAKLPI